MKIVPEKSWKNLITHFVKALNSKWYKQLVELENFINVETMKFYEELDIITMHLPITTGSISSPMGRGSDSSPVKVNLCGIDTYLADSMQFMLEYGCRYHTKGCYYIMPSFRGEMADERHLCQFYHSEAEITGGLNDVMNLVEHYILHLSTRLLEQKGEKLRESIGDISHIEKLVENKKFYRVTFDEAVEILQNKFKDSIDDYIEFNKGWRNITRKGEMEIMKNFDGPVWITHYDTLAVPFYQAFYKEDKNKVLNADLLMGIGETVGCGERHANLNELEYALKIHEVDSAEYQWYMKMKEKFPLQTSGFGMGVERFLMWVLKCDDIRDLQLCPRFNGCEIVV